ncbi:MAG: aldo/keto reductase [Halodesulfurarchaeum sp.]
MDEREASGATVPTLGFGTYRLYGDECARAVRDALEMGYRHVDTAEFYDNHRSVGRGIAESSVDRADVFLTSKVWKTNLAADQVHSMARKALSELGSDYLDLLLIHGPNERVPIEETIGAMNELQGEGAVNHIGVSNFSVSQLEDAMAASQTPIVTNQVEYHPRNRQDDLLEFALENDVLLTAYSPLGKGSIPDEPVLRSIGDRYGKTPAQVALRWLVQQPNVLVIPKAATRDHRYENAQVFDFSLSEDEMRAIFDLGGPGADRILQMFDQYDT